MMHDDASFEREALPCLDDVYRYAYSLTRDRADADDLVQETYLRARRSWHTFALGTSAVSWLFTICRHQHIRLAQQASRHIALGGADVPSSLDPEEHITRRDIAALVCRAIASLDEPYRSTIVLVDVEDQSYQTAATIFRVPLGTIRSRLFRARRAIRGMLSHSLDPS
jgi:RNA polymerase sigma-70 factor (ECF subfamily)